MIPHHLRRVPRGIIQKFQPVDSCSRLSSNVHIICSLINNNLLLHSLCITFEFPTAFPAKRLLEHPLKGATTPYIFKHYLHLYCIFWLSVGFVISLWRWHKTGAVVQLHTAQLLVMEMRPNMSLISYFVNRTWVLLPGKTKRFMSIYNITCVDKWRWMCTLLTVYYHKISEGLLAKFLA